MQIPQELRYTDSHEWARQEEDGTITFGITDHAQEALGEIVFAELPEVGDTLAAGDECGAVESTKAASDIYAPFDGEIVAVNQGLDEEPLKMNQSPYDAGWFARMKPADPNVLDSLLSAEAYDALLHK